MPPLLNVFNLKHAPVVNASNNIGTIGDIKFVNQNTLPILNTPHPAFKTEIKFRLDFLPATPGQYSVDYSTGTVYVFGANVNINDGTGATPPLAIYNYRLTYKENIDWIVDPDSFDVVALDAGNLLNAPARVSFNFEQVLAQDIDYKAQIHIEVLDERINNKLLALNALEVNNAPITNVFRVFNETSGEIYSVTRWNNSQVFFTYTTPPVIEEVLQERASFQVVSNELLFVNTVLDTLNPLVKIFKIVLTDNNIMAQSEDCVGASFNNSVSFSDTTIFAQELYFDSLQSEALNLTRLTTDGYYFIDYKNGVVYTAVSSSQDFDIGAISYKRGYISPVNSHITNVEDIYYRINTLSVKNKHFDYTSFGEGFILPKTFDIADEQFLSNDKDATYVVLNDQIGAFVNEVFVPAITDSIQFVRHIYEINDLLNNLLPINFASATTFTDRSITVSTITHQEYQSVEFDGANYYVLLNTGLTYLSPNITYTFKVVRLYDSQVLLNNNGTVVLGNQIKLILPGAGSPNVGDSVLATYTYTINDLAHVVVDYNKGEYYVDYTALTDEIIVSYEYGNNALDFRQSNALNPGDTYFVSYKYGALRDALLKNFGSLLDISLLNSFDISLPRERYRDALMAAMHTFSQGPTIAAIKNIAQTISHIPPEIDEMAFDNWSLGSNLLSPAPYKMTGDLSLTSTKYDNGIIIDKPDQTITLPIISNFKLEDGTFETWVKPEWDGLDNLSELKISITKDGYLLSPLDVFIGALEYHPEYQQDINGNQFFVVDKFKHPEGKPNKNKNGVYFYLDNDVSGLFKRWFVEVIDGYTDGYASKKFAININTTGKFYDVKSTLNPQPASTTITSGTNSLLFVVNSTFPNEGITFVADTPHYIFDFAEKENKNRFSLFKDESGYLTFKVFDKFTTSYTISADVSNWRHGDLHHIAVSWKLNTKMGRDELHLFIDGFEVPNIIRYGDRIKPYLHEKFRTVNPEEIVGVITHNIVASNDLITTFGSNQVSSSIDFSAFGVVIGDTLYIEEDGFDPNGYTILNVNGNILTLNTVMPFSITNGSFSANKTSFDVSTEIDIFPNFAVYLLHSFFSASDLSTSSGSNTVMSSTTNFITVGVKVGDLIRINNSNFAKHYVIIGVASHTLTLNDDMPINGSGLSFDLYHDQEQEIPGLRAIHPAYQISKSTDGYFTNILTIKDKAQIDDIVLIKTLGINHRRVRRRYYSWSNQHNIIKTKLPTPISLDEVKIYKVLLSSTYIGLSNATLLSGVFHSNHIATDQPINSPGGRTLGVSIQGDNVDFSTPTTVNIVGTAVDNMGNLFGTSETLTFTAAGIQYTTNFFADVAYITVNCKPFNPTKNCAVVEVKEKYPLTVQENIGGGQVIVRYSYQVGVGNTLSSDGYQNADGYVATDNNNFFSSSVVGNALIITNPPSVAGFYDILGVSDDHKSITLGPDAGELPFTMFSDGYYEILNTTDFRSGLQNGFFTFEYAALPGDPYNLTQGLYEFDYYTYLAAPFDLNTGHMYIGSDFRGKNQFYGSIDELQILNTKLTDTRVGETAPNTQRTITKDFNSVKASKVDVSSLVLTHFDTLPPVNSADIYVSASDQIIQAGEVINDNFTQSIAIINQPLIIDNDGILNPKQQGTIEFWINPIFDTQNDPNFRFYFDAFGAVTEQLTSINSTTINLLGTASQVLEVRLQVEGQRIDYFAGGTITNNGSTLLLNRELPYQNTPVFVSYLPKGLKGDRISIYKDPSGYLNFNIRANNTDYQVRAPIFWSRDTWHRVKASYKVNSGILSDELHLFIDGYERGDVLFGNGLLFGQNLVFGSSFSGPNATKFSIKFTDAINRLFVGSDYNSNSLANCLIDNLRISDIARPLYQPFGEPLDPNYSSNLQMVFPITEDLNTTLLLNFDNLVVKNTLFAILNNKKAGLTDFSLTVFDNIDIINNNATIKSILEALVNSYKAANSRAFIYYK